MQESRPFPIGLMFTPSDEQLIESYLYRKISGTPIPFVEYFVIDCDLYGDHEPSVIWESHGGPLLNKEEDLYFFTQLKPKGSRICRKVAISGAWQGENAAEEILSTKTKLPIGFKKRFRYENEGSMDDGHWIMHENSLHPSQLGPNQSTSYVLCRIRNNQPTDTGKQRKKSDAKKSKKRKRRQDSVGCESEATTSVVTMLEQESSYRSDMKICEQHVVTMADPDQTQQESHQPLQICLSNAECQYQGRMAIMLDPENRDIETSETLGIDYYDVTLAEADEIVQAVAIAISHDEDCNQFADLTDDDFIQFCDLSPVNEFDSMAVQKALL